MDELYFENSDVSLVDGEDNIRYTDVPHTVCKMVLRISGKKPHKNPSPFLCVIAVSRQKINSPDFVGFK